MKRRAPAIVKPGPTGPHRRSIEKYDAGPAARDRARNLLGESRLDKIAHSLITHSPEAVDIARANATAHAALKDLATTYRRYAWSNKSQPRLPWVTDERLAQVDHLFSELEYITRVFDHLGFRADEKQKRGRPASKRRLQAVIAELQAVVGEISSAEAATWLTTNGWRVNRAEIDGALKAVRSQKSAQK